MTTKTPSHLTTAVMLFAGLLLIYVGTMSGVVKSDDERIIMDTVDSLVTRGDVTLNQTVHLRGLQTSDVEPAQPVFAAPLYWIIYNSPAIGNVHGLLLFNPIVTALTAALVYLFALQLGYQERTAIIAALLFGLTTIAWPYTKTFFREPFTALNLLAAVACLDRWRRLIRQADQRAWRWLVAGVAASLVAILSKEVVLLALPMLLLFAYPGLETLKRYQRRTLVSIALIGVLAMIVGLLIAQADVLLDTDISRYEIADRLPVFLEGLDVARTGIAGFLWSPGKSIWVFSPVLVLALASPILLERSRWRESWLMLATMLLFVVAYAAVRGQVWHGGLGWGSRYMVPLTPFLLIAALPALERLLSKTWGTVIVGALAVIGFLVQIGGVTVNIVDYSNAILTETGQPPWQVLGVWTFEWSQAVASLRLIGQVPLDLLWAVGGLHLSALIALLVGFLCWGGLWLLLKRNVHYQALLGAVGLVLTGGVVLFSLAQVYDDPRYRGEYAPLHEMLAYLDDNMGEEDIIMLTSKGFLPFFTNYYKGQNDWYSLPQSPGERYSCSHEPEVTSNVLNEQIAGISANMIESAKGGHELFREERHALWLLQDIGPSFPCQTRPVEHYAARYSYLADVTDIAPDVRVIRTVPLLTPQDIYQPQLEPVRTLFGNSFALINYMLFYELGDGTQPVEINPGEQFGVALRWRTLEPVQTDYTVGVYLISPEGQVVLQHDRWPVGGFDPTSTWQTGSALWDHYGFILPEDLPPGAYTVNVAMYEWPSLERLPLMASNGEREGDLLTLTTIYVK